MSFRAIGASLTGAIVSLTFALAVPPRTSVIAYVSWSFQFAFPCGT
jgi:hypothetical protein